MPKKKGGTPSTPSSTISSSAAAQRFSRTKTGCFTCRARRKKCDEERDPQSGACTRCRNSGIECLGFPAMKSAPASAFKKQRKEEARQEKRAPQEGQAAARAATREVTFEQDRVNGGEEDEEEEEGGGGQLSHHLEPMISQDQHTPAHARDVPEENVARWADLMALDDGEQLFYEGLLYDVPFENSSNNINLLGTSTLASSRAISVDLAQVGETPSDFVSAATSALQARQQLELEQQQQQQYFHHQQQHRPRTISMEVAQQEQRMLTVLANYYAVVSWYRWQPVRHSGCYYSKEQLASSLLNRLERSEVLCISVASVAACYAYGDTVSLPENSIQRSLLKHWTTIYDLVTSTKTRKLTAFLEWLTQTSLVDGRDRNGDRENNLLSKRKNDSEAAATTTSENHRDTLFSLASQVLEQISQAANQDQELPMDRSNPLDTAALVHVDKYVHAAMDLATVAYATRSSRAFLDRLNSASELVSSLLGRSQCVRLADLQGIETTGFRAFAWADIINAVLSGRSTFVHYLSDDEARNLRLHAATQQSKGRRGGGGSSTRRGTAAIDQVGEDNDSSDDDDDHDDGGEERGDDEPPQKDGLRISFGCPDDVLIVMAAIANLHFQLRHARKAKALSGQGYEALPAWALHTALEYGRRLSASQAEADARHHHQQKKHHHPHQMHHHKPSSRSGEQHYLATMWRHAAFILLNTSIYRQGPLSASNQSRLTAILDIYKSDRLRPMTIALGSPALTLLLASFVAVLPDHRKGCLDALDTIGQRERGRRDYRHFVKRLWKHSDETGFAVLWQDLLLDDDNDTTLAIF